MELGFAHTQSLCSLKSTHTASCTQYPAPKRTFMGTELGLQLGAPAALGRMFNSQPPRWTAHSHHDSSSTGSLPATRVADSQTHRHRHIHKKKRKHKTTIPQGLAQDSFVQHLPASKEPSLLMGTRMWDREPELLLPSPSSLTSCRRGVVSGGKR